MHVLKNVLFSKEIVRSVRPDASSRQSVLVATMTLPFTCRDILAGKLVLENRKRDDKDRDKYWVNWWDID